MLLVVRKDDYKKKVIVFSIISTLNSVECEFFQSSQFGQTSESLVVGKKLSFFLI